MLPTRLFSQIAAVLTQVYKRVQGVQCHFE